MNRLDGTQIKFHFHPFKYENKLHTIEKSDGDRKRRYLCGVSSGLKTDGHGERMTDKCIKSFMDQANSGDVLLYPDVHGIKASEDIGILTKAEIQPSGDWYTEYALYDEKDGIGSNKAETINTIWKQINGLPPYQKPRQKGFSIEGFIPETSIILNNVNKNTIDDVLLDGVVLVPRPAYQDSIATAIFKALGETTPERAQSLQTTLREVVQEKEVSDEYYKYKWDYTDALERTIEQIMNKNNNNKNEELKIVFDEYKDLMINLIINSAQMFVDKQTSDVELVVSEEKINIDSEGTYNSETQADNIDVQVQLYKNLLGNIQKFIYQMKGEQQNA